MTTPSIEGAGSSSSVPGDLTARLAGVLDLIRQASVDGLPEGELLQVVTLLESAKGAAAALQARATARFVEQRDDRAAERRAAQEISDREATSARRSTRSEVALARRVAPGQADRHVGCARALVHELPRTMAALTAGLISEWRATLVVRETACLSPDDRLEADRRLAEGLTRWGDKALVAAAQRICIDLDQEALVERRRRAVASRRVSVRPAPDGMAWLSVLGPMVEVVGAHVALRAAEQARHVLTGDPETDAARVADQRSAGAWQADTALELLSGRAPGQPQPVEVGLVMSESVLLPVSGDGEGRSEQVEVTGVGPMPPESAREHLLRLLEESDDAIAEATESHARQRAAAVWLRRLWASPDGRDLVAMDSTRRRFHGGLRRFVELRDQTCRVPWCDAPVTQVDHVIRASRGGATSAANGLGLCQRHNLDKEQPGWTVEVTSTGLDPGGGAHEVVVTAPTGGAYRCTAPPLLGSGRENRPSTRRAPTPAARRRARWPAPRGGSSLLEAHLAGILAARGRPTDGSAA